MNLQERQPGRVRDAGTRCSQLAALLAGLLLVATFLLISPPPGRSYPGAIPWGDLSVLRRVTELMSLYGLVATARGVEIKDFAFHLAATAALALVGVRSLVASRANAARRGPVLYAQVLMLAWVGLSLLSSLWAGDGGLARGQALLYALNLAWAIALATALHRMHLARLVLGLAGISAVAAALCIWYYYERNPFHRPGFPLGNPNVLAAAILPAILIAAATLWGVASRWFRDRRRPQDWPVAAGAAVALVPLLWCFLLTGARGATLALAIGLAVLVASAIGRRLRIGLAVVLVAVIAAGAAWWYHTSRLDMAMGRGATVRFRLYAWRYAAELWQLRPMTGLGAAAYPRLAGALSTRDRALDPAAFMGELVEHAHNELFEILTEIGLLGGVTYVGGLVATFLAAVALLRPRAAAPDRWLLRGLVAGLAALVADAMTGPSLRLPGVPAIFHTLLGCLWAACATQAVGENAVPVAVPGSRPRVLGAVTAGASLVAAGSAGWLTWRDWSGVRHELAASVHQEQRRYTEAQHGARQAEARLLDPVRVIGCRRVALEVGLALTGDAYAAWQAKPAATPLAAWQRAVDGAKALYAAAARAGATVPALIETDAAAARAAEWLARLYRAVQPAVAADWDRRAEVAWHRQRNRTPYDVETLLALTRYPAPVEAHVALLRDALRFGEARGLWLRTLSRLGQVPGFAEVLDRFVAAAGPISEETGLDLLVTSMAPETWRLDAAWRALQGDYAGAATRAGDAARLYLPMRPRFPNLHSLALAEQADYVLRGSADDASTAVALLRRAIAALPEIQAQKYEDLARPFRFRLTLCLLAAGDLSEALATLRAALGERAGEPGAIEQSLQLLLREAAAAGLGDEILGRIRATLSSEFPSFRERDR